MTSLIMHVDMDAFFAAVEELADPTLKDKALAVAGPGDRSILTTASYRARSYGIKTGMTAGQAKRLCRDLIVLRADYRKYAHASRLIMDILESFTPMVNALSVDEAFMEISHLRSRFSSLEELGGKVKEEVLRASGLSCSVGIGPGRLLAKLASTLDKPDGLTVIRDGDIGRILEKLPVGRLCGIGPVTAEKLRQMGITSCGQLGRYPLELLERRFGKTGRDLSGMGRGQDPSWGPLSEGISEKARSIGHCVTLPRDLTERESMKRVLLTLSEMVGRRIRRYEGNAGRLTFAWKYNDFSSFTRQKTLPSSVHLTREIYSQARSIFDSIEFLKPVRLLGISLSDLSFQDETLSLLQEDGKGKDLQEVLDSINDRYGEFSLAYGGTVCDLMKLKVISPAWRGKGIKNSF